MRFLLDRSINAYYDFSIANQLSLSFQICTTISTIRIYCSHRTYCVICIKTTMFHINDLKLLNLLHISENVLNSS